MAFGVGEVTSARTGQSDLGCGPRTLADCGFWPRWSFSIRYTSPVSHTCTSLLYCEPCIFSYTGGAVLVIGAPPGVDCCTALSS